MIKTLKRIPTQTLTPADLGALTKKTFGGAEAAIIAGSNPYQSPYGLYASKVGLLPQKGANEAMRIGRDLEGYVATRFCMATGKRVRRANALFQNEAYPFAHALVDRLLVGEDAGLECKTTSALNLQKFKGGTFPSYYYTQCLHYMAVTGCERWYLAVLVLGGAFYHYVIERDEAAIKTLMEQEAAFYHCLETSTPPPLDGEKSTSDLLSILYPKAEESGISLADHEKQIDAYFACQDQIKALEGEAETIKQGLKLALGEHEVGTSDRYQVTWQNKTRKTFQHAALAKAYPQLILAPFFKQSTYRSFDIQRKESAKHGD